MLTIESPAELILLVGTPLEPGDWLEITQERINDFADATGDHQWIHVDPERAKRESPFGDAIAHGYLTLSLLPYLLVDKLIAFKEGVVAVNYGSDKIRYPSPVLVGSKVRLSGTIKDVVAVKPGVQDMYLELTIEIEGVAKPALVAMVIYRFLG